MDISGCLVNWLKSNKALFFEKKWTRYAMFYSNELSHRHSTNNVSLIERSSDLEKSTRQKVSIMYLDAHAVMFLFVVTGILSTPILVRYGCFFYSFFTTNNGQ